jgi:tetratricopeptide (TPR) repeat protein
MKQQGDGSRDRKILEMVNGLFLAEVAFQEVFKKYKEDRLCFSDIGAWVDDKGQSLLYTLKEQCHALFRSLGKGPVHKNEWLLDLAIGSIFHEAMKLRENIYQIEVYRPRYLQFKLKLGKSAYEKGYLQHFERIISKAELGVLDGIEETRSLFKNAMAQLIEFFKDNSKNPFLSRFLLEHHPLLQRVYGSKRVKEIFNLMFKKGLLDAYYLAGHSYLQSAHYDLSSLYFSKALKMNPRHRDLGFLINFSLGMKAYFENDYSNTLSHFEKTLLPLSTSKVKKEYVKKMEEICNKISFELEDEEALEEAKKARLIAGRIKKC